MKVSIQASDCPWCQKSQLVKGFESLGHKQVENWYDYDVDFVFVGNGPYDEYIDAASNKKKKIIFNVLDIATQNANAKRDIDMFNECLPVAARVTTISEFTQWQVKHWCSIDSTVIYYPMKPVFVTNVKTYAFKILACGRVNDPNKRFGSAIELLKLAGYKQEDVAIVGPEPTYWGTYLGVVNDETLNNLYNSVDYVVMLDKIAGLGLPAVEGCMVGAIPIIAPDLSTYRDFWESCPMSLFYQTFTSTDKIASFLIYMNNHPDEKINIKTEMARYANSVLRPKFDNIEVAKRILAVAQSI